MSFLVVTGFCPRIFLLGIRCPRLLRHSLPCQVLCPSSSYQFIYNIIIQSMSYLQYIWCFSIALYWFFSCNGGYHILLLQFYVKSWFKMLLSLILRVSLICLHAHHVKSAVLFFSYVYLSLFSYALVHQSMYLCLSLPLCVFF